MLLPISTVVKPVHPENADDSILVTLSVRFIVVIAPQLENDDDEIEVTLPLNVRYLICE